MAMQPGIDRALSGSELDRNASGTGQASSELFLDSESLEQQCFTLLHLIVLELQPLDLGTVLQHYPTDIDAPDVNGRTALLWAAWKGDCLSVSLLVRYSADVDKADNQSWTPLARAAKAGHLGVVQYLLDAKACLTIATSQGFQPIHHASENKDNGAAVVKELLLRGADPHAQSNTHGTPLHSAANRGSPATIERLLAHGSNIDALDVDGDTPVMTTLLCWNEAAFVCLVRAGARLDIARKNGHTAVHVAVWGSHARVWSLLIDEVKSGKLNNVDISVEHNGHQISVCFHKCRNLWFTGVRDLDTESILFRRMVEAFSPGSNVIDSILC
jgi:ankyrin repeat protein